MSLSGVHVVCGFVSGFGVPGAPQLLRSPIWSETLASAGTTANAAPAGGTGSGEPCFEVRASADSYVSVGKAPDASQTVGTSTNGNARVFIPAGETRDIICSAGDRLNWAAA